MASSGGENNFMFKEWKESDVRMISPLKLAYIGDAVYEVYIRRYLLETYPGKMHQLHRNSTKYVSAKAQADFVRKLESFFTDEENNVIRRGRNAKSGTVPKNTDVIDYNYSTGFEALIGYLYLNDRVDRIEEIIKIILEK